MKLKMGNRMTYDQWADIIICSAEYNACTKIKISEINDTSIKIDFNYEVVGLGADKNLLKSVTDEYKHVVDIFNDQINRIFSE